MSGLTQHQKILNHMASDPTRWWLPQDFMRPELGELFVGYEASARLSELAKLHPDKIESQRQGKYMARRLKPETVNLVEQTLNEAASAIGKKRAEVGDKMFSPEQSAMFDSSPTRPAQKMEPGL